MIVSPKDGSRVWIADTGDGGIRTGDTPRPTVALWMHAGQRQEEAGDPPARYPDGDPHDAEALLMSTGTARRTS